MLSLIYVFHSKHHPSRLLWIPRSLLILVGMFFFYFVVSFWLLETYYIVFYVCHFAILLLFFWMTFHQSFVSGCCVILYSLYGSLAWTNINSFKFFLTGLLGLAGVLLVILSFFSRNKPITMEQPIKKKNKQSAIPFAGKLLFWIFSPVILIVILIILLVIYFTLFFSVLQIGKVSGYSMTPTIHNGALLSISKLSFSPKRGNIIQIDTESIDNNTIKLRDHDIVKRIIGLPGETVEWKDYQIYINGKILHEPYQYDAFTQTFKLTNQFESVILQENEFFVMGDNRSYSSDSRYFGLVKRDSITGLVFYIHNRP